MKFANAPVSYGVFGDLTVDGATTTDRMLDEMRDAGYAGTELGPPGFFGDVVSTRQALHARGLTAVGAYVPLHTQDTGTVIERDVARYQVTLEELAASNSEAIVILADEGNDALLRHPRKQREQMLERASWCRLVDTFRRAAEMALARGLQVSVHPHISTFVELPEEIEQLLIDLDAGLTLDTGHLALAGGDLVPFIHAWRDRINHVHMKDVKFSVFEQARAEQRPDFDAWWATVCTPLGRGDLELAAVCKALRDIDYQGWVVVEQDRAPLTAEDVSRVFADQRDNLQWLEAHLSNQPESSTPRKETP